MSIRSLVSSSVLLAVVAGSASACDSGDSSKPAPDATKNNEDAELEKRVAERREKRLAEQKAAEEAEAKKKAALDAVCVLPKNMPKKLADACKAVGEAQDAFMKRMYADDPGTLEKWSSAKNTQLPMTITTCTKTGSIEAAACQANALTQAPPELAKELPELLRTCIDKFGKGAAGGTVPPK